MNLRDGVSLPQNDPDQKTRIASLNAFREKFQYDFSVVRNVPISAQVPEEAKAGFGWNLEIIKTSYKLRRNWEKILEEHDYVFEEPLPHKSIAEIAKMLADKDLLSILGYSDPDLGIALKDERPRNFRQYFELFKKVSIPEGSQDLENDADFADYFVAGLNPVMIHRLRVLPEKIPFSDQHLRDHKSFSEDTVADMLEQGRLFMVDYEVLEQLSPGEHPQQPKFVYAPIVLLGIPKDSGNLEILAIQNGQDASQYPLLTPSIAGRWDWLMAKTLVKTADANYHEVVTHLGLTHLVIDPIVIASFRQLPPAHPLHKLLIPHFEGTLPINALAVRRLINKGGKVEQLLAPQIESGYEVIELARNSFHFRESFLPNNLSRRGVGQDSALRNYPYRDDGLLIWNAIERWVSDYVNLYYQTDEEVRLDHELQAWTEEISSPKGGRIKGFVPFEGMVRKQTLVETLTMIIFTASAQHAAVNFPQGKAAAVPYQPLAGYAPAPMQLGLQEEDATAMLPPLDRAIKQLHTLTLLGATYYTQLGQYKLGTFQDKRIVPKLWRLQYRLLRIEGEINRRNLSRRTSYEYLKPSKIPQSINI